MTQPLHPVGRCVTVRGPGSLSNLGPGYDILGVCIGAWGDEVDAFEVKESGVFLVAGSIEDQEVIPLDSSRNTASVAAEVVLRKSGASSGLLLRIRKGVVPGSGIGSSAASAVGGAWAAREIFAPHLSKHDVLDAALIGEAGVSGARHGDNVVPALFGGITMVDPTEAVRFRDVPFREPVYFSLVLPDIRVLTKEARAILPASVPHLRAVENAAALAFFLDAVRGGDWQAAGEIMMTDRIVEPVRSRLVPCYEAVKQAAIEAGSFGCALSGSGPAMFAVSPNEASARAVLTAMQSACDASGIASRGTVTTIDVAGARTIPDVTPTFPEIPD